MGRDAARWDNGPVNGHFKVTGLGQLTVLTAAGTSYQAIAAALGQAALSASREVARNSRRRLWRTVARLPIAVHSYAVLAEMSLPELTIAGIGDQGGQAHSAWAAWISRCGQGRGPAGAPRAAGAAAASTAGPSSVTSQPSFGNQVVSEQRRRGGPANSRDGSRPRRGFGTSPGRPQARHGSTSVPSSRAQGGCRALGFELCPDCGH
jgi:hypothetical protein